MLSLDTVAHFSPDTSVGRSIDSTALRALLVLRAEVIDLGAEGEVQPR